MNYSFVNGQALLHLGKPLSELYDVGDIVDFYFGVITQGAEQKDIDKIRGYLEGTRDADGNRIGGSDMAEQLAEMEAFMNQDQDQG